MAGLGPQDIDVAELYDCFTIVPIIELEELGFCEPGEGGAFFADGHARIGGKLPVNTHGGMLSHAHAGAAGGLFGIVEAVRQLRGGLGERQVRGRRGRAGAQRGRHPVVALHGDPCQRQGLSRHIE